MNPIPILVKLWISLVWINGERQLKMKLINQEKNDIYVQENFNYRSIMDFGPRPDYGMILGLRSTMDNKPINIRCGPGSKKLSCFSISLDSNSLSSRKYHRKALRRNIFYNYPDRILYMNKTINKNSKILILRSADSLVHYIKLQDNVFLKGSYCKAGYGVECHPIEVDSLQLFARLMFKYSFKPDEKPKYFSYFILDSDTIKLKLD